MVLPSRPVHSSDGTAYPPPALGLTRKRVSGPGWLPARLVEVASASALLCEVVTGWCGRPLHSSQPLAMRWNKLRLLLFSGYFFPPGVLRFNALQIIPVFLCHGKHLHQNLPYGNGGRPACFLWRVLSCRRCLHNSSSSSVTLWVFVTLWLFCYIIFCVLTVS